MKKIVRSAILFVLSLLLVFSLFSCSKSGSPGESSETSARDSAATESGSENTDAVSSGPESDDTVGEYTGEAWLEKSDDIKETDTFFGGDALRIMEIYTDCFFAKTVTPLPQTFKINGDVSDNWCVGDVVECKFENVYYDRNTERIEADLVNISASDFELDPDVDYKPVIYLYPEKTTNVHVSLDLDGEFLCTYPAYENGWEVTAFSDGTLRDKNGMTYNYLYWEGKVDFEKDFSDGFCVKGEDTAKFLESALESLGLTRREANEFIVYWLPQMQDNPYNLISFDTDAYEKAAKLNVDPAPDTVIRVFMMWKASDEYVELAPQTLDAPERVGFTVVEWGGSTAK